MKQDFLNYIQNEFLFSDKEIKDFEESIIKPLKKSIRINTNKISISDFKKIAEKKGWILTKTNLGKNTFYIDRFEDLDLALGNTLEHINGYFYIQEVAASSSPYFMSGDLIDENPYLILDMSASPGGKTTGISEYYPNSIVVANEINKQRLKGLFVNLDRMGSLNVVSTNYDGKFFTNYEEIFNKVLLDAPCSGEGTAYKTDDSLKYWNLKNIKSIAKLQISLLDSAVKTLKVNGEIVYSTCTLNKIENEGVINEIFKRYEGCLEIVKISENDFIRSWPHIDHTGGFFVVKIKKIKSVQREENKKHQNEIIQNYEKLSSRDTKLIEKFLENNFGFNTKHKKFYKYKNEIFMTNKNIEELWRKLFLYKIGVKIGELNNGNFEPDFYLGTLEKFEKNSININEKNLDYLLKGEEIKNENILELKDTEGTKELFFQICIEDKPAGIIKIKNGKIKSLISTKAMRK